MTETANLVLSVDSRQVTNADKALGNLEKAGKRTEKATDQLRDAFKRLAGPLAVAGAVAAIKSAVNEMDNLSKTAQKIGVTTESLSKLQYAAKLADVSVGELQMGMTQLIKAQYDAANGSKQNALAFEKLGVTYVDASGKLRNADAVMSDIAEAFAHMRDGADKTALAVDIFGRSGANMIPLLNSGAQGLREAGDEAERFGVVISTKAGKEAEEFNDQLTRMGTIIDGVKKQAAIELMPILLRLADPVLSGLSAATLASARGFDVMTQSMVGLGEAIARSVGGSAVDDLAHFNAEIEKAQKQLNLRQAQSFLPGSEGRIKEAQAEVDRLTRIRDAYRDIQRDRMTLEHMAAKNAAIQEIDPATLGQRKPEREVEGPNKKNTRYASALMREADMLLNDALRQSAEKEQDRLRSFESVQQIKFGLLDSEGQSVMRLQAQYTELQNAVEKGAISQADSTQIAAGLAEQWVKQQEDSHARELESLYSGLLTQEEAIQASYDRRREQIIEALTITEEEKTDLLLRAEQARQDELDTLEQQRLQTGLHNASALAGGLAGIAKASAGEQSKAYRVLFGVSKAFAIAEALVALQQNIAASSKIGFPQNLATIAGAVAQGASIIGSLQSVAAPSVGSYDAGGFIPAGQRGMVAELGTEVVTRPQIIDGPARVTGRRDTAAMMQGEQSQQPVTIRNINLFEGQVIEDFLGSNKMEKIVVNHVRRNRQALGL